MKIFRDKVAVITGAAEGIGRAIAMRAAAEGMKLVLVDIDAIKLEAAVAEFKVQNIEVIGVCADVSKAEQVDALAAQVFEQCRNVHLLVNNAGVSIIKPVWETTPEDWAWVMGVNLYGVTNSLRAFIPTMLKNDEEGYIINTASTAGLTSQSCVAAYNASKHAVITVSEGLHHDLTLRDAKIKVSVLCPLWVKTRIDQAERNRPPGDAPRTAASDAIVAKAEECISKAVENGVLAAEVADALFDAIAIEQFYILTDPAVMPAIRMRMKDILCQRQPTSFGFNAEMATGGVAQV
ncbi:SDR family NAD(P)-dependent oxidoreductase [Glaciimonas immobilis]|uniref:NAD(P)-dependent dehydrogenase (Short-subunit alcohol dehydrogenase family) n=1 Tax=Glaciimonas immobilis TaxID=728004 RepID=A0A840RY14_9BURK|nr:SDR family NAD(P)-dependent oxidoreductase [Glaciimonas immobilis]KAF3998404.1 SDR family NAD(P)-dependent oxidoreductase [Glaciimonas immobilis]MBB5202112.1 NAD(P)-dependent dehydrogenase (short-subunit alcohol dehydrogenase family) [Glaciimonas immobilis]